MRDPGISTLKFAQQFVDSAQPGPQVVGRHAVRDAQIVGQAKVVAGDDEHTLVVDQPLASSTELMFR